LQTYCHKDSLLFFVLNCNTAVAKSIANP